MALQCLPISGKAKWLQRMQTDACKVMATFDDTPGENYFSRGDDELHRLTLGRTNIPAPKGCSCRTVVIRVHTTVGDGVLQVDEADQQASLTRQKEMVMPLQLPKPSFEQYRCRSA
mmetsp:Transcript_13947/g.42077  ORF Transcript_13947/g.42077 Transcript_13947/m.42077 type:complete len:116 (-) Transcript_13947:223-570(-)